MNHTIKIDYRFMSLNEYTRKNRNNKYKGAQAKKDETSVAYWYFKGKSFKTPIRVHFKWLVKNKRTDPDNLCFAKKFLLDGMVEAHAIPNDNMNHILGFSDEFEISTKEGVIIEVEEV